LNATSAASARAPGEVEIERFLACDEIRIAMLDHMVEQFLLALEISIEHPVIALGRLADAVDAGAAIAFARELRDCSAQ